MAEDWEKLAGGRGEAVPAGRLGRLWKLGSMGARVAATTVAGRAGALLGLREETSQETFERSARHMVEAMGQLKGASMKIGQLLSADPELTPEGFSEALAGLQRSAPPMPWETICAQVEAALDRPIDAVFRQFDPEPLGAASIGQVHRAILDDGREVAVKIQYPGVLEALESDLKTFQSLVVYARAVADRARVDAWVQEVRAIILQEADYEAEARNLSRFHEILKGREGLRAPAPVLEWCRPRLLVMEFVHGQKFDDALAAMEDGARKQGLLARWVETFAWMFHELHEMHADPHPGNFLLDEHDKLVLLDFGCVRRFDPALTDGVLEVLDACWQRDPKRALRLYEALRFGEEGVAEAIDPALMDQYHQIILEPFLCDATFDFSQWRPAMEGKAFMMRHPALLKLAPPAEALAYFRTLSGIKGLLARAGGRVNVCAMSMETARRRGRLSPDPQV
jgi:predicted unusual protein kinase regulating ubiquinone biosynthesis (AarF/ABC1/UbiB family)